MASQHPVPQVPQRNWRTMLIGTRLGWVITLALAALGAYLFIAHAEHLVSALPYLLLVACPLMHVFMHGGHGHRHEEPK